MANRIEPGKDRREHRVATAQIERSLNVILARYKYERERMTNKTYCTKCLTKKFELIPVKECKNKSHRESQPIVVFDTDEGGEGAVEE